MILCSPVQSSIGFVDIVVNVSELREDGWSITLNMIFVHSSCQVLPQDTDVILFI